MAKIIPGILTDNEKEYQERLHLAEHVCDLVQIDVVDGLFSKNKTVGAEVIKKYPSSSQLEIQLMVNYPLNYIDDLARLDYVSRIIFPFEIEGDIYQIIYKVKNFDKQVGISINNETPVESVRHFFDDIDLVLLLTGKPGYSGQSLGGNTYQKIKDAKKFAPHLPVEIDIGVNFKTAPKLVAAGADFLVASSTLYGADDFYLSYQKLAKLASKSS